MAIYHFHIGVISRRKGRTAVASSAYRTGERLENERDSKIHDFTYKKGVVYTEIMLPTNAPAEFKDRATLWNVVEKAEKRCDAQTARDIDVALPVEFDKQEQIAIMRQYIQINFVDNGMIADFAIHDKGDGNPHAHIMLTMRDVNNNGFGNKNRDWNSVQYLKEWRENWANICNERLQAKGLDERIDHRTLKAQGIDREPTKYIGVAVKAMEHRNENTLLEETINTIATLAKKEKDVMRLYFKNKISFEEYEQITKILKAEKAHVLQNYLDKVTVSNKDDEYKVKILSPPTSWGKFMRIS